MDSVLSLTEPSFLGLLEWKTGFEMLFVFVEGRASQQASKQASGVVIYKNRL